MKLYSFTPEFISEFSFKSMKNTFADSQLAPLLNMLHSETLDITVLAM